MKAHERFFQQEIQRVAKIREQKIRDDCETKTENLTNQLFEEIKTGKAILIPDCLKYGQWTNTPPIGDCFSFADGSRLDTLCEKLQEERKESLQRLRTEVAGIIRAIVLDDLDKPTLSRMLTEFEWGPICKPVDVTILSPEQAER